MADHYRKAIRNAVVAQLKGVDPAWRTAAQGRIYGNRMEPMGAAETLPIIIVYCVRERVDATWIEAPRRLKRILALAIEAAVDVDETLDDTLDALAKEIEVAMHRDDTLGGLVADTILTDTEMDLFGDAKRMCGAVRLTYECTYFTEVPDEADMERDDLATADIRYNVGGALEPEDEAGDRAIDLDAPP